MDIKVFEVFQVKFKVGAEWQGSELSMSLSALACTLDWCLQEVPVIKNIRFDGQSGQKQSIDGNICIVCTCIFILHSRIYELQFDILKCLCNYLSYKVYFLNTGFLIYIMINSITNYILAWLY